MGDRSDATFDTVVAWLRALDKERRAATRCPACAAYYGGHNDGCDLARLVTAGPAAPALPDDPPPDDRGGSHAR